MTQNLTGKFKAAVYAGTFSPITLGHHDIVAQAAGLFDKLYIAVAVNGGKNPLFTLEERVEMIKHDLAHDMAAAFNGKSCDIEVVQFEGATARFMKEIGAPYYVRGLRIGTDFDSEYPAIRVNQKINPDLIPVLLCSTNPELQDISSTIAREACRVGEDGVLESYVTPHVKEKLIQKMNELGLRPA